MRSKMTAVALAASLIAAPVVGAFANTAGTNAAVQDNTTTGMTGTSSSSNARTQANMGRPDSKVAKGIDGSSSAYRPSQPAMSPTTGTGNVVGGATAGSMAGGGASK